MDMKPGLMEFLRMVAAYILLRGADVAGHGKKLTFPRALSKEHQIDVEGAADERRAELAGAVRRLSELQPSENVRALAEAMDFMEENLLRMGAALAAFTPRNRTHAEQISDALSLLGHFAVGEASGPSAAMALLEAIEPESEHRAIAIAFLGQGEDGPTALDEFSRAAQRLSQTSRAVLRVYLAIGELQALVSKL